MTELEIPRPTRHARAALTGLAACLIFALVVLVPVIRRLVRPTILGDDVTRIVDLVQFPFREHLFLPFAEHVAPLFQLVSRVTWDVIGHDVRLAPLGFSAASVLSWVVVLALLGLWLWRETGSRTAALVAVALAAQSPLVLETAWWYSASSFLWAIAGILVAILGSAHVSRRPILALSMIGWGAALGLAGTTLGILAAPLAILRAVLDPSISRRLKAMVVVAAVSGVVSYQQFCKVGGVSDFHTNPNSAVPHVNLAGGLGYAMSVPGQVLWPSIVGVPVSWMIVPLAVWIRVGLGAVALAATVALAIWPGARWNRRLVVVGAAMIYWSYTLTYSARAVMVKDGVWTEPQLLYLFASRYHVLPLLGLVTIIATLLASSPRVRRCDSRRGRPEMIAAAIGLITMAVQSSEVSYWNWMLDQPEQRKTLSAIHHLGELARTEGVPRSQLMRIFDPVYRSWNGSLIKDCPRAFHLMNLAIQAPEKVDQPLADDTARARLLARLSPVERISLGAGTCASLAPAHPEHARTVSVARRVALHEVTELTPGRYHRQHSRGYIEFEFDQAPDARYLVLPGLATKEDVVVFLTEDPTRWRGGQNFRWLGTPATDATVDLKRLINWPGTAPVRIRMKLTGPGELALAGPPRLVR